MNNIEIIAAISGALAVSFPLFIVLYGVLRRQDYNAYVTMRLDGDFEIGEVVVVMPGPTRLTMVVVEIFDDVWWRRLLRCFRIKIKKDCRVRFRQEVRGEQSLKQ